MKFVLILSLITVAFASEKIFYIYNKKNISLDKIDSNVSTYKTSNGILLSIDNKILIKFINLNNFYKYMEDYNLSKSKKIDSKLYQFQVFNKSKLFNTINSLALKNDIKYAEPDFIKKSILR